MAPHVQRSPAEPLNPPAGPDIVSCETFAHKFCRHFEVPMERFTAELLRRTLYGHARLLLRLGSFDALSPDRDFARSVGRLTRPRDFTAEIREFQLDRRNTRFWRRRARLRVSVRRMQRVFTTVWDHPAPAAR